MEYALTAAVMGAFLAALIIFGARVKPQFFEEYDDERFLRELKAFLKDVTSPKRSGASKLQSYRYKIKRDMLLLSFKGNDLIFSRFKEMKKDIKALLKGGDVGDMPYIDGEARIVSLAKFSLAHNVYVFSPTRAAETLEEQNRHSTLTFFEVEKLREAYEYALIEKLCFVFSQLMTLKRAAMIAKNYVFAPSAISAKYKDMAKSRLFLSICSVYAEHETEIFSAVLDGVLNKLYAEVVNVLESYSQIKNFDFSRFYTPLEILDKYSAFFNANAEEKRSFMTLLSQLSDKEGIDEFIYAVRLDKYMATASSGHMKVFRRKGARGIYSLALQNKDISALGNALSSGTAMRLIFGSSKRKNGKSIIKIGNFENSYEPIYKFKTVNFGLSTVGGVLRLMPRLPREIVQAELKIAYKGVVHDVNILRGEKSALFIGNTELVGTTEIRLSDIPLCVTLVVSDDKTDPRAP